MRSRKTRKGRSTYMREYLGSLQKIDPLHLYLTQEIQPILCGTSYETDYRVFRLGGSKEVYLYEDDRSGHRIVGKFYASNDPSQSPSAWVQQEFDNLCTLRSLGLSA